MSSRRAQILALQLIGNLPRDITLQFTEANIMARKYIDCREFPSDMNCSVAIAADNDQELLDAAVQHAVAVHKHQDTPELRQQIKQLFKEGTPPIERPVSHAL
jgi:predicted small metal-binding protein